MPACSAALDDVFGPQVNPCRRTFDFTLLFEEAFFSIVPSVIFISLAAWRLWVLREQKRVTVGGPDVQKLKLVCGTFSIWRMKLSRNDFKFQFHSEIRFAR